MATKNYTKWQFFPADTVTQGAGVGAGIVTNGFEQTAPYPLSGAEITDCFFHLAEYARESATAKDIIEALGETYDPNNQPQQLKDVLADNTGEEIKMKSGEPTSADFTDGIKIIVDTNTGDIYTLGADGNPKKAGGGIVATKGSEPTSADFTGDVKEIIDTSTGTIYTIDSGGNVIQTKSLIGSKAGIPDADDFTSTGKMVIVNTNNGAVYSIDSAGNIVRGALHFDNNSDPDVNEDDANGYVPGDTWTNTDTGDFFILRKNDTGSADWFRMKSGAFFAGSGDTGWQTYTGGVDRFFGTTDAARLADTGTGVVALATGSAPDGAAYEPDLDSVVQFEEDGSFVVTCSILINYKDAASIPYSGLYILQHKDSAGTTKANYTMSATEINSFWQLSIAINIIAKEGDYLRIQQSAACTDHQVLITGESMAITAIRI